MQIHEQKMKELEEQQQKRLYFESQNIIRGPVGFITPYSTSTCSQNHSSHLI